MTPDLERYLWDRVPLNTQVGKLPYPRDVIADMVRLGMIKSEKQAWRTLEKWTENDLYEYGVTLDLGWRKEKSS